MTYIALTFAFFSLVLNSYIHKIKENLDSREKLIYKENVILCRFLIHMTQRSIFSINRTKYLSKPQAFAKVTYHGFSKCEGKCYPNT